MQNDQIQTIAALLREAGAAHGAYEARELNGVYDQNWPDWYAAYLLEHGLGDLLGAAVSADHLSGALNACDEAYKRERPPEVWPEVYAARLIDQFGAAV